MGFSLKSAFKALVSPNPKDRLPGGAIRAGFNQPLNARSVVDPSGQLVQGPQSPTAQTQVTPYQSHLSPGAQALKDSIMARRQQRMNPTPVASPMPMGGGTPGIVGTAVRAAMPPQSPTMRISDPRMPPMVSDAGGYGLGQGYADGGKVKKKGNSASKVFVRKPNGKPY